MTTAKEHIGDRTETSEQAPVVPGAEDLDPTALAAIRDLLASETQEQRQQQASEPGPTDATAPHAPESHVAPRAPTKRELLEQQSIAPPEPQPAGRPAKPLGRGRRAAAKSPVRSDGGRIATIKAALLGYRPTPRHIVIASAALVILFRPWLVVGVAFLSLFILTGVFLILGYDGFWRRAMGLARWYARRHPSRAVELHRKLDTFAMKWDAILDRFPEGTVDGLYLPDFGDLAEAESKHDAALDRRFSEMREREA